MRKRLVVSILKFTRLLIENSTSRKLYNSYEHLNNLLFARDVDVLQAALHLLLRFAQQQSNQHPRPELAAAQERLATLAVAWSPRDHGMSSVDLARNDTIIPPELLHVRFQFYKRRAISSNSATGTFIAEGATADDGLAQMPTRPRPRDRTTSSGAGLSGTSSAALNSSNSASTQPQEGMTTIDLGKPVESGKSAMDVLADAVEANEIPSQDHFELFQRIRLAMSMTDARLRHQLLVCRLFAIACYAHVTSEGTASTQLFLYEPDVVQRTAELVKPEHKLSQAIVGGAFYALDALGRYRSKLHEVLSSLSASVNHGVLMQALRSVIDDLATGDPKRTNLIIDPFYGLVSFITSTSSGSNLVVGAGLVQLLVQLLENAKPETYIVQRSLTRTLGLLDSLVYAYLPAFELFCQARGLDILVLRIEEQVEEDIEQTSSQMQASDEGPDSPYGKLTFGRAHMLRGLLQSISHMMVSTGTADGLRNLIDTSLVASIKKIMENRGVFGPQNLALAINIMATFVHNEPTTLGVIQEKQLPGTFLNLVKNDIEAHFDVISAIPNAVGALCLNQAGLDLFSSEPIIAKLLSLLTSERHIKVLSDQDNVTVFGGAIDELIRHQPTMKEAVIDEILKIIKAIHAAGRDYKPPEVPDVAMYELSEVSQASLSHFEEVSLNERVGLSDVMTDDADVKKHQTLKRINSVASSMDITARFLEIFFQSTNHCKDFLKTDGLDLLLEFYELPCLSYNFASSTTADSMVHLLRFISEVSPNTVIHALLRQVKISLSETKGIWNNPDNANDIIKLMYPTNETELKDRNGDFRKLIKLNARIQLLCDVAPTFSYTVAKTPATFLQVINSSPATPGSSREIATMQDLGEFQRAWVWQSILFKAVAPSTSTESNDRKPDLPGESSSTQPSDASHVGPQASTTTSDVPMDDSLQPPASGEQNEEGSAQRPREPLMRNAAALRYIVSQTKLSLASFFAETNKLLAARRTHDHNHKRLATLTASQMGKSLRDFLVWRPHENTALCCAFATCAITQTQKLLYDDRHSSIGNAQTVLLVPFIREGGLDELINDYRNLIEAFGKQFDADGRPNESSNIDDAVCLGHACSATRACMELFLKLVSAKPLLESPSTQTVSSKEGTKRSSAEHFEPHEALIRFRHKILPVVQELWDKQWLSKMPVAVHRLLLEIILRIVEAEGETVPTKKESSANQTAAGQSTSTALGAPPFTGGNNFSAALAGLTGALGGIRQRSQPQPPDEGRINQLVDMGFPRRAARHALGRCLNNVSAATEYLLTHPEIVTIMSDDSAEPPTAEQTQQATEVANEQEEAPVAQEQGEEASQQPAAEAAPDPSSVDAPRQEASTDQQDTDGVTQEANVERHIAASSVAGEDVNMSENHGTEHDNEEKPASEEDAGEDGKHDEEFKAMRSELNELRKHVSDTLVSRSLQLADQHDALIFDVKAAIQLASDGFKKSEHVVQLIEEVQSSAQSSLGDAERFVSVRLHLLALSLNDSAVMLKLSTERAKQLMSALRALLDAQSGEQGGGKTPAWMSSFFLVLGAVMRTEYEMPHVDIIEKDVPGEGEAQQASSPAIFDEDMPALLDYSFQCLRNFERFSADDLLAFFRFLVLLTRRRSIAEQFSEKEILSLLLRPFASSDAKTIEACRPHAVLVMRQVVEADPVMLRHIMSSAAVQWFKQQRTKTVDTTSMGRSLMHVMMRDPPMFIEIMKEEVQMIDYSVGKGQGFLKLPDASAEKKTADAQEKDEQSDKPLFRPPLERDPDESMETAPISPTKAGALSQDLGKGKASTDSSAPYDADPVMHFLLSELLRHAREMLSKKPEVAGDDVTMDVGKAKSGDDQGKENSKQFFYVCFLLQALTELLSSYASCKTAFLSFTKKRGTNSGQSGPAGLRKDVSQSKLKQPSMVLSLFLNELVPLGFLCERKEEEMRRTMTVSNWAMSVVVALCAELSTSDPKNAVHSESLNARKTVLDAVAKSIREATTAGAAGSGRPLDSVESRYGRLYALSDLSYRLLKAHPNSPGSSASASGRQWDEATIHLAKTMLERNFVTVLTGALADVDLNLPMVKPLLERILKPLEHLSKVAIKMNKPEKKGEKHRRTQREVSEEVEELSSAQSSSDDDMDEDEDDDDDDDIDELVSEGGSREETPDFYRNSSLGMHTGDLEGGQADYDEDDVDDEDEDMDDEMPPPMGYDEEGTDDDSEDDDDIEEHIVEVMDERDDSDEEDDDDEDDDSEDEDEGDDGEEGSWIDEDDGEEGEHFVLEGHPDEEGQEAFDEDDIFQGDEGVFDDGNISGPILIDGDPEDDEDDEGEEMEEDEGESMLEEVFDDGLQSAGFTETADTGNGAVDRFGANWGWASSTRPSSSQHSDEAHANQVMSPFAFIRQRPAASRGMRGMRRLMDWEANALRVGRPRASGGAFISGIGADGSSATSRDVTSHPLLVDNSGGDAQRGGGSVRAPRSQTTRRDFNPAGEGAPDWARSLEELMQGGAMQFLETLLSRNGMGGRGGPRPNEPIQISLTSQGGVPRMSIAGPNGMPMDMTHSHVSSPSAAQTAPSSSSTQQRQADLVSIVQDFSPQTTSVRWNEAMRIIHGPLVSERTASIRSHVVNALRPQFLARQEEHKRKRAELEEEKRKNGEELEKAKQEKERVERELHDARAQFEDLRRSHEQTEQRAEQTELPAEEAETQQAPPSTSTDGLDAQTAGESAAAADGALAGEDTLMAESVARQPSLNAPSLPGNQADLELGSLQQGLDELDTAARHGDAAAQQATRTESSEIQEAQEPNQQAQAAPQAEPPRQRVTTTINGSEVDITDSGIDPTFLEALPDDMREEVLNQHFRERRAAQAARGASSAIESSNIAPEFLDALPPEIRAEVIQQEAVEQHRHRTEETRRRGGEGGEDQRQEEMDPASFLATLNPDLRSAVLMDGDERLFDSLPEGLSEDIDSARQEASRRRATREAEASARTHRRFDADGNAVEANRASGSSADRPQGTTSDDTKSQEGKKPVARDAIQLLDKPGVAALVRLMFFPQLDTQQSGLRNVLVNLSENSKTRSELLNLLLMLLAEGCSSESNAVDRSYSNMSGRVNKPAQTPTRPSAKRNVSTPAGLSAGSGSLPSQGQAGPIIAPLSRTGDEAPFLIASRSIDMLLHLTSANEHAAHYFLKDDPSNSTLMKWFMKNSKPTVKGKERVAAAGASNAPVNILLVLLSKPSILSNAQLVDSLIALLNTVTRPLPTISANLEKAREAEQKKDAGDRTEMSGANTQMGADAATIAQPAAAPARTSTSEAEAIPFARPNVAEADAGERQSSLPQAMPQIPDERMAAVVKPLSTSISSKGFQHTLAVASHLAAIEGAREVITGALHREATLASQSLLGELDTLLESLPEPPAEMHHDDEERDDGRDRHTADGADGGISAQPDAQGVTLAHAQGRPQQPQAAARINSPALTHLASPSSSQTVILRSLRALEWVMTRPGKSNSNSSSTTTPSGANVRPGGAHGLLSAARYLQ